MGLKIGSEKGKISPGIMTEEKTKSLNDKVRGDKGDLPVKALIAAFKDDNPEVREEAAEMLERIGKTAVVLLIDALDSSAAYVREYSARVLGNIADPGTVLSLTGLLKDQEPAVRERAAEALGNIGYSDAIKPLIATLKDTNAGVRRKAAEALDRIDWIPANQKELSLYAVAKQKWKILPFIGQDAVEPLIEVIKSGEQPVRDGAVEALGRLGNPASLKPIIEAIKRKQPLDPEKAFTALSKIADSRTMEPFIGELDFDDGEFRQKAADLLDKIGWQPTGNEEAARYHFARQDWDTLRSIGKDAVEPLAIALKDKDPNIRGNAVKTLGEIGDNKAVAPLIDVMDDVDASVRNEAVIALGKIVDPGTVKYLIDALKDARYDKERVIDALGEKGDPVAVEYLTNILKDTSWEARKYREAAARALGNIKDARAVESLLTALKSKFYEVRKEAAEALGKIGDEQALLPLIDALNDDNPTFREIVVESLCSAAKPGKTEPLVDTLKDRDAFVRQGAAQVLSRIGWKAPGDSELAVYLIAKQEWDKLPGIGEYAAEPLIAVLEDENPEVRKNAVITLGRIGNPEAVEPLIDALKNHPLHDSYMKDLIDALGEIGDVRALEHLTYFINSYLEEEAKEAFKNIRKKSSSRNQDFFCTKCFQRVKRGKVKYPVFENNVFSQKSFIYYACVNCHSNSFLLKKIEKVALLLDHDAKEPYMQDEEVLSVNWLKIKEPFDFDEIRILKASDFEVEELVMKLKNDSDDKRLKRLPDVPVYISAGLDISPAKMNLLKDNFTIETG